MAVEAIGRRLAETIPGARMEWHEDCEHFPMFEAPTDFARTVSAHIG